MDKNADKVHRLTMNNRENLSLTGAIKVQSFDPKEILLETVQGILIVKGDKLGIKHLDLKEGLVEIEGFIEGIVYPRQAGGSRGNLWSRIFR